MIRPLYARPAGEGREKHICESMLGGRGRGVGGGEIKRGSIERVGTSSEVISTIPFLPC